jgi:hypothetical protein
MMFAFIGKKRKRKKCTPFFKYKHRLFFIKFLYFKTISLPIRADSAFIATDNLVAAKNAPTESIVNCVPRKKVSVLVFQLQPVLTSIFQSTKNYANKYNSRRDIAGS